MDRFLLKTLLSLSLACIFQAQVMATTYYASPSGSGNGLSTSTPTSISNAINNLATTAGDNVILAAGTYNLSTRLTPLAAINISGVDTTSTIINAGNLFNKIFDIKYNCNISNLTIKNSSQNDYSGEGGAIRIKGTTALTVTLNAIKVTGCSAYYGNAIYGKNSSLTINNSNLTANVFGSGNGLGGALYLDACTTTINNTIIAYNKSEKGSGVYAKDGTLILESCSISNNGANPGTDSDFQGGGIYLSNCNATINNSKIKGNLAFSGAGIYAVSSSSNTLNIDNTNIYSNSTNPDGNGQGIGGGLYLQKYNTNISYSSLSDNTAGLNGGSMFICGGSTNLEYCTLSYNNKTINWSYGSGGIYISNICGTGTLDISYSIISGNESNDASWLAVAGDDLNADTSSSAISIANSILGSSVYDESENVTSTDFDPNTDLAEIDEDGNVAVTDSAYEGYGARAGIPVPTFISSATDTTCSETLITYTTQSGFSNYEWTIKGSSPSDYEVISGGISSTNYTVTIKWHTYGEKTVSVNYKSATGRQGSTAASSITFVKITPNIIVADGHICGSGTIAFHAESDSTETTFKWYDSLANGNLLSSNATYTTSELNATTSFYVSATNKSCTTPSRTKVTVYVAPDTTHWIGSTSTNWADDSNWNPAKPGDCSVVFIDSADNYPDISAADTITIHKIVFDPETSIFGLEKLKYDQAFVSVGLKRNKWYLLTTPLKEMYSGDYYFNGAPIVNMKLFGTTSASYGTFKSSYAVSGDFTQSFASLTEELAPGEGFAFQIDSTSWNYPNGVTNNNGDTVIVFPKTNTDGSLVKSAIPYSSLTGKLYPNLAKSMDKDSANAYRFAMENESGKLDSIIIPVKPGLNLIGNPLMSNLDFNLLYNDNDELIHPYVKLWDGQTFQTVTKSGLTNISTTDASSLKIIPPMKSFVVFAIEEGDLVIKLSAFTSSNGVSLRSASSQKQNTMYIEAANKKSKKLKRSRH